MINLILVFIDTMHYTYKDKLFMVVLYIDLMVNSGKVSPQTLFVTTKDNDINGT